MYSLQDFIKTQKIDKKNKIPVFVGIDKEGKFIIEDLTNLYHIFIAGETGSGKSTILNAMLQSMMYFCGNINFIFVDFKLVELGIYDDFSNCYCIENNSDFIDKLIWLEEEMMKRYKLFKENRIKNIWQYNKLGNNMNYIILVIDEISNIKLSGNTKKKNNESEIDIEDTLANLLNMARASGIFIIAATQNPYGVELKTNVRSKFVTNISGRIERTEVQKTTTVLGTENFKKGEFKMNAPGHRGTEFKSFFIDDLTHNKVFEELEKIYSKGGVNIADKC
jgi:S-DNA-T family DNA segregation ATPase FtsK/SpoIIIE